MAISSDPYLRKRSFFTDVSSNLAIATTDSGTKTLATAKAGYTIYVQRLRVDIVTDAAQHLTFEDSNGTPVVLKVTDNSPGANTEYIWDFGPDGWPLTQAKNFVVAISAAGLGAEILFEAYQKQTATERVASVSNIAAAGGTTGQDFTS